MTTPSISTPVDSLASLKDQGNAAFRSGDYSGAIDLYSSYLSSTATSIDEEERAAVLSNRSAALIHLYRYDLALLDAHDAKALRPEWSKPLARVAEAYSHLQSLDEATSAYNEAIALAEDEPTLQRYTSALLLVTQRQEALSLLASAPQLQVMSDQPHFQDRYLQLLTSDSEEAEGMLTSKVASQSWSMVEESMKVLDENLKVGDDGMVETVSPSPVLDLADAILLDPRGFHIPEGTDQAAPLAEKLTIQISFDFKTLELEKFAQKGVEVENVFDEIDERRDKEKDEDWQRTKLAMAGLIRGTIVQAFINEAQGNSSVAVSKWQFADLLIEEGRRRWSDVPDEDRGMSFSFTFARKTKMMLLIAMTEANFKATTENERMRYSLSQIELMAEEIMDEALSQPVTSPPESWLAYQITPIVQAGKSIAYCLGKRSREEADPGRDPLDQYIGLSAAAAKLYGTAGNLLQEDDPDKSVCLYLALSYTLRSGTATNRRDGHLTAADVFARAAEAEKAMTPPERIFGPTERIYAARTFVQAILADLRKRVLEDRKVLEEKLEPVMNVGEDGVVEWLPKGSRREVMQAIPGSGPLPPIQRS